MQQLKNLFEQQGMVPTYRRVGKDMHGHCNYELKVDVTDTYFCT